MTDDLTAELARLNAGYRKDWDASLVEVYEAADEFLDLANKLHALLVQAEGGLRKIRDIEIGHSLSTNIPKEQMATTCLNHAKMVARQTLTALHAAGIGGSDGK